MRIQYQNTLEDYREMTDGIAAIRRPVNGPIQIVILMAVFGLYYVVTRFLWQKAGDATGHLAGVNMAIAIVAFGVTWLAISLPASFRSRRFPWLTGRQWISVGTFAVLIASLVFQHWMNRKAHPVVGASGDLTWQIILPHSIWLVLLVYVTAIAAHNYSTALPRRWESRFDLHRHESVDITAEGITFNDSVTRMEYQWPAFIKWEETKKLFLLFTSETIAIMVPKRGFASAEQINAMRNLLRLIPQSQMRGFPVTMPGAVGQAEYGHRLEGAVVAESARAAG